MADNSQDISSAPIHSIPPASIVQNSNFSNAALHKLRASLFSCTTQANQTCENLTNPVREFIRPYQQTGNVLRWYGVADAINLSFSLCGMYYFFKHSYQNYGQMLSPQVFQLSTHELHAAESTPEGLALAVLFTVFLVGFSTLGSHYDENRDEPWVKNFVFLWPFFRTAGKQIKWWAKGWWALLSLLLQYQVAQQDFLIQLFFPLAMLGGIFAAMNSVWLRWMRDQRKEMVKNNLTLIEGLKSPLHILDKMPNSLTGYGRSLICLQETTQEGAEIKSLHYVNVHVNHEDKEEATAKCIEMRESEWCDFYQEIEKLQTENIHARMKQYLCYINRPSVPPVEPSSPESTTTRLHFIADQSEFNNGAVFVADEKAVDGPKVLRKISDSYVYFSQSEGPGGHRLYYVNSEGMLVDQGEKSAVFHKKFQEVQQDKNVLNLSTIQLKSVQHAKIKCNGRQFDYSYNQFVNLRHNILNTESEQEPQSGWGEWIASGLGTGSKQTKIKAQYDWVKVFAPISAGASGIGDGLYFYIFVAKMTVATLSPYMATLMLGASAALFITCIVTRIAEEFDFQRRLEVTVLRTEAELSKKNCGFLHEQLEKLLDYYANSEGELDSIKGELDSIKGELDSIISTLNHPASGRAQQLKSDNIDPTETHIISNQLSSHDNTIVLLWNELSNELKLSKSLQDQLRVKLNRSYWAAGFEGLQNGLAIQGAIASFSFMISSLCYVSAAACPPAFMLTCLGIGIAAIVVSLLQGWISHYFYLYKVQQTKQELSLSFHAEMLVKMTNQEEVKGKRDALKQTLDYVNNQPLEPPVDFVVIEWSEIFRLLFKGAVKGKNAAIEALARFLDGSDNKWLLPVVIVAGAVGFSAALGMRATAKGFAVGRPDSLNTGNVEKKARTFFDGDNRLENISVFHASVSEAIGSEIDYKQVSFSVVDPEVERELRDNPGGSHDTRENGSLRF